MKSYLSFISVVCLIGFSFSGGLDADRTWKGRGEVSTIADTITQAKNYSGLLLKDSLALRVPSGVKSLLFNSAGNRLYALNLEGMTIYEFDRENKRKLREFNFIPTKAKGWDYQLNKSISSFAEKPVEACFSHNDKILWVSLHNAGGIVPIILDSLSAGIAPAFLPGKSTYVKALVKPARDTLYFPLIKTGEMPKVIARTADSKFLIVSNWGSKSVSILQINDRQAPYGKKIATIALPVIPRGIVVDDKNKKTYVALMGGNKIDVINNKSWKIEKNLPVFQNPRHVVIDTAAGRFFVSFNSISQVSCFKTGTGKFMFKTSTHSQPRTIALSNNQRFLFVTCYAENRIDVFKIGEKGFSRIYSIECAGKPVGIDLYEDQEKLEAWVCSYRADNLNVYTFEKNITATN